MNCGTVTADGAWRFSWSPITVRHSFLIRRTAEPLAGLHELELCFTVYDRCGTFPILGQTNPKFVLPTAVGNSPEAPAGEFNPATARYKASIWIVYNNVLTYDIVTTSIFTSNCRGIKYIGNV